MFGAAAACRDKHRLQPCEPKPRPAEARKTRPAGFGTRTPPVPLSKPIKPAVKQPQTNNDFLLTLPRHYAASGLLNLRTTLTEAVTPVTPGVKLPLQR